MKKRSKGYKGKIEYIKEEEEVKTVTVVLIERSKVKA